MKPFCLTVLAVLLIPISIFSQIDAPVSNGNRVTGINAVSPIQLGSSSNIYTMIRPEQNQVFANPDLGIVAFIHQQDSTNHTGGSGILRYDVSIDSGASFTDNIGPLNAMIPPPARSPNIVGLNPFGANDPLNTFLTYSAHTIPATPFPSSNGKVTGLTQIDTFPPTISSENLELTPNEALFPSGLCEGKSGEFWTVEFHGTNSGSNGTIYVNKGVFNTTTIDVDWARSDTITPPHYLGFDGSPKIYGPNIAFSPDGTIGWIAWLGDLVGGTDSTYHPCFVKSTDGGASWGPPIEVDLLATECWMGDSLQTLWRSPLTTGVLVPTSTGRPTCAYEFDLIVDENGDAHFLTVIGSATTIHHPTPDYTLSDSLAKFIGDVHSIDQGTFWGTDYVSPILCFEGVVGSLITVPNFHSPQIARSKDGKYVFYSWVDSDTSNNGGDNVGFGDYKQDAPNLRISGKKISNGAIAETKWITDGDFLWHGVAYFQTMAPIVIQENNQYKLPIVLPSPSLGEPSFPTHFYYFGNDAILDTLTDFQVRGPYDTILYTQDKYSTTFYFQPSPAFPCEDYSVVWDFGNGDTSQDCPASYLFSNLGSHQVTLTMTHNCSGQVITSTVWVEVLCPAPNTKFTHESINPDSIRLVNLTPTPTNWNPNWLPITYTWSTGGQVVASTFDHSYRTDLYPGCTTEWYLSALNNCGGDAGYSAMVADGYTKDLPKDLARTIHTPGNTPIQWRESGNIFAQDSVMTDRIDDGLNTSINNDILVYYHIPPGYFHTNIKSDISNVVSPTTAILDRFSDYLTVVNIRNADQNLILDLLALPYVVYIQSDNPVPAYSQVIDPTPGLYMEELMEVLGVAGPFGTNCFTGTVPSQIDGAATIGVAVLGGGRNEHFAFQSLTPPFCINPPPSTNHSFPLHYTSFLGLEADQYSSCAYNVLAADSSGLGIGKASILAWQNNSNINTSISGPSQPPQSHGLARQANFFFPKVVYGNGSSVRASDVIEAVDWVINTQSDSPHVNILICDFDMARPSNEGDAVAAILEIASRFGVTCIAGTGMRGTDGMTAAAAAPEVITVAPAVMTSCGSTPAIAQGAGEGVSDPQFWSKPDISAPSQVYAGHPIDILLFDHLQSSPEVSAMVVGGLAALICEVRPDLTKDEIKLLLTSSADDILSPGSTDPSDPNEGHGFVNIRRAIDSLSTGDCYHLGFDEHINSQAPEERHNSKDITILLPAINPGSSSALINPGNTVSVEVDIHNYGQIDYPGYSEQGLIKLEVHYFGTHDILFLAQNSTVEIPFIPAGGSVTLTIPFISNFTADEICCGVDIVCPMDTSKSNNQAKKNDYRVNFGAGSGLLTSQIMVGAPSFDSVYIYMDTTSLAGAGYLSRNNFVERWYYPDELPFWVTYSFSTDTINGTPQPAVLGYDVTFYAVSPDLDTMYNGGVHYTFFGPTFNAPFQSLLVGDFELFPNPAEETVQVRFTPIASGRIEIELVDLLGRIRERRNMAGIKNRESGLQFQLEDYSSGVYLVRIRQNDATISKRMVKL